MSEEELKGFLAVCKERHANINLLFKLLFSGLVIILGAMCKWSMDEHSAIRKDTTSAMIKMEKRTEKIEDSNVAVQHQLTTVQTTLDIIAESINR